MSAGNNGEMPEAPVTPETKSRLFGYMLGADPGFINYLGDDLYSNRDDEGYSGSPPVSPSTRTPLNFRPRSSNRNLLKDVTNVVILQNLTSVPYPLQDFARDCLGNCEIHERAQVKLSKRPDMLFIYDLRDTSQRKLASYIRQYHPLVSVTLTMGIRPYPYVEEITDMLVQILRYEQRDQMSYEEIYDRLPLAWFILTIDFPYDPKKIIESIAGSGIQLPEGERNRILDKRHPMMLISVRCLAPLVHRMISVEPRNLDREFLQLLEEEIAAETARFFETPNLAPGVDGERERKPLEHLVTCVPGVEVVWTDNRKVIRKLELPERPGAEPATRNPAAPNVNQDAIRQEQEIVKRLSDVLKRKSNLYMTLGDLEQALNDQAIRVGRSLRQFITERPKHFQILGEDDYEVVTLSHRAQIKRVCNDLQKVLRPRKPKCISSVDMPAAFASHWQAVDDADRSDRRFNVEDFGVCYLDDLLVTIPQHWGVHCSEYVSTDGEVIRREHGNGDEDIPDFVPKNETGRVHAWIPKHHQTETQKKALALLKQQVLNMFRGDPSAERLIEHLTRHGRNHGPEYNRLLRLAYLRANRPINHQGPPHNGRDNPSLPCNLRMEERTFVPLYHRFCGEQVALVRYGVKDLFELFDSMQDTFLAIGIGQERMISLTTDAKREILERRIVDILRTTGKSMTASELLLTYRRSPTMGVYYSEIEIGRAISQSKLIERTVRPAAEDLYRARPMFECSTAVDVHEDIGPVLMIFMMSYAPLAYGTLWQKFYERTGRRLDQTVLVHLVNAGAVRRVCEYDEDLHFDLHDVCRVVRNLVYKMNEQPKRIYTVEQQPYVGVNASTNRDISVASLLSFTGDFTFIEPEALLRIMCDFKLCFERITETQFKLRNELQVWVEAPEELQASPRPRPRPYPPPRGIPPNRNPRGQAPRFTRHPSATPHFPKSGHRSGANGSH